MTGIAAPDPASRSPVPKAAGARTGTTSLSGRQGEPGIFWLKDESLADSDNLPPPEMIAQEIVDDLEAALEQFRLIAEDLSAKLRGEYPLDCVRN